MEGEGENTASTTLNNEDVDEPHIELDTHGQSTSTRVRRPILTEVNPTRGPLKKALIWDFFEQKNLASDDGPALFAVCKKKNCSYKNKGRNTTTMKNHWKKHAEENKEYQKKKAKQIELKNRNPSTRQTQNGNAPPGTGTHKSVLPQVNKRRTKPNPYARTS